MGVQLDIFNSIEITHGIENNVESNILYQENKTHFSNKCLELLKRLLNGERLIFNDCIYTIGDLRRRSLDLIQSGIPVQRTFIEGTRIKEYWIKQEDIVKTKEKFKK